MWEGREREGKREGEEREGEERGGEERGGEERERERERESLTCPAAPWPVQCPWPLVGRCSSAEAGRSAGIE